MEWRLLGWLWRKVWPDDGLAGMGGSRWREGVLEAAHILLLYAAARLLLGGVPVAVKLLVLAALAALNMWAWTRNFGRYRALVDMPESRIASAAQGYARLAGYARAVQGWGELRAPVTFRPCVWYRAVWVEGDERTEDESDRSFWLDDGSGRCLIDPDAIRISPDARHRAVRGGGQRVAKEWIIPVGARVHALGDFHTRHASAELDADADVRALLHEWKQDQAALHRRFDLNGDGRIDQREWELARRAARREVLRQHAQTRQQAHQTHHLRAADARLNLLWTRTPQKMALAYCLLAWLHLVVLLAAVAGAAWVLRRAAMA